MCVCMYVLAWKTPQIWFKTPPISSLVLYVTRRIHTWRGPFICDVTGPYVTSFKTPRISSHYWYYDAFTRDVAHSYVTWLFHTWHHPKRHESDLILGTTTHSHVTWPIHMWRDSFICGIIQNATNFILFLVLYLIQYIHTWIWLCITYGNTTYSHVTWPIHTWRDSSMCDIIKNATNLISFLVPCVTRFIHTWR